MKSIRRLFPSLLCLVLATASAPGQEEPKVDFSGLNVDPKVHTVPYPTPAIGWLNGMWQCLPDPTGSLKAEALPATGWKEIRVPGNWNVAGLDNYNGVVWYRTKIAWNQDLPKFPVSVQFKGVDYFADVWCNGTYLGNHEGYFQTFEFNIAPTMKVGDNDLLVRVNAPAEKTGPDGWPGRKKLIKGIFGHHDCRPGGSDPRTGQDQGSGGIWNDVNLIVSDIVRIERLKVTPKLVGEVGEVTVEATIRNHSRTPEQVQLLTLVKPSNFGKMDHQFPVYERPVLQPGPNLMKVTVKVTKPELWWTWDLGRACLYDCDMLVVRDGKSVAGITDTFGFRTVEVTPDFGFKLNGKRLFIRGTNVIPTQWLGGYRADQIREDMQLLRAANVNSVRVHAHVQREEFYRACDDAGILVWADFALQWSYNDDEAFKVNAVKQAREWVSGLYNRPSIAVWCCHNEPSANRKTLDLLLEKAVREEDPTRFVTPGSDFTQHPYPGWYAGNQRDFASLPSAPFISEYGAQALPNVDSLKKIVGEGDLWPTTPEQWKKWAYHNFQYDQTFNVAKIDRGRNVEEFVANSQDYQAKLLKYATENYRAHKWEKVNGLYQFMFMDPWPGITWSVVDAYRKPKAGYDALKTAYQPLLPTFVKGWIGRDRLEIGSVWSLFTVLNLTIVNDYPREFPNAKVTISLRGESTTAVLVDTTTTIPADAVMQPLDAAKVLSGDFPDRAILARILGTLAQAKPGKYRLVARVASADGLTVGENFMDIELVAPVVPTPLPF